MKLYRFLILSVLCHVGAAQAEIYKRVDANGHVTYSSTPLKGSQKLQLAPLQTMPPPAKMRSRNREDAADFPRVDSATQKDRDSARRKILEDELVAEEKALAEVRRDLQEGEKPESYASKAPRGGGKRDEKSALQERVETHEKNIEALKTELAGQDR